MRKRNLFVSFALLLLVSTAARAQSQSFIPVEGANLQSKLDAARKLAASRSPQTRFWTAYSFEVRPGVAVDFEIVNNDGSISFFDGAMSFSTGSSVETRNLGVFLLHLPDGNQIVRVEVFNLERRHEYSGYPVYWLGRAGNEESLNLLKSLVETGQSSDIAGDATKAIALHDDRRVDTLLENIARSPAAERVRTRAIFWLGQTPGGQGGKQPFLYELARNEQESIEIRGHAISAFGQARDAATLAGLQNLYGTLQSHELKRRALSAIANNNSTDAAVNFLIKVANSDPDREMRKKAIAHLGRKAGQQSLGALVDTVTKSDAETEVQKQAVHAISQRPKDEAVPLLIKVARTHPKPEVRKQAILLLARSGDERAVEFFKEILLK